MNDVRRKRLIDATANIETAKSLVEDIKLEEEESYENLPESMQNGEKGEKAQAAIDALGEAVDSLEQALDQIATATE